MRDFTLIFGCMFSGKTTKLLELYYNSEATASEKIAIKPLVDNRYNPKHINTHTGVQLPGHRVNKPEEITTLVGEEITEVYLDEVQFFSDAIYNVILDLTIQGKKVVAAGLDIDFMGRNFGAMEKLQKLATNPIQLYAKCTVCQLPATHTARKTEDTEIIITGSSDIYEARCRAHWQS